MENFGNDFRQSFQKYGELHAKMLHVVAITRLLCLYLSIKVFFKRHGTTMVQYQDSVLQLYNPTPYPPPGVH